MGPVVVDVELVALEEVLEVLEEDVDEDLAVLLDFAVEEECCQMLSVRRTARST